MKIDEAMNEKDNTIYQIVASYFSSEKKVMKIVRKKRQKNKMNLFRTAISEKIKTL